MRTCAHCGHSNEDRLPYCAACGKRARPYDVPDAGVASARSSSQGSGPTTPASGLAATVALGRTKAAGPVSGAVAGAGANQTSLGRAREAVRYVFTTFRGRIDAEERRRQVATNRREATQLSESILIEIGQTVLAQAIRTPELAELCDALTRIKKRREAVIVDLAAAEKLQAAEDLRLGLLEASIEAECDAYERSVAEVERTLASNESERTALGEGPGAVPPSLAGHAAGAAPSERVKLDDQHRTLRERASALRASSLAARARLDQAKATRKRMTATMAAAVAGHTRERATIDEEARTLTTRIGARAVEVRVASPYLAATYERFDRLQEAMRSHDAELTRLEHARRGLDLKKLALGVGVIGACAGVIGASVWALLR